jgi:3-hydroxyisobutyrate dehydrogenase
VTSIAWLGLGAMGAPMAARLVAGGHEVTAYDVDAARIDQFVAAGGRAAASPAQAAAASDVLAVMVATPDQAEQALFGADGALATRSGPMRCILFSTLGPAWVRSLASRLPAPVGLLDAPVSGGVARAGEGTLLIMASGTPLPEDEELLRELGDPTFVGEKPGDGQAVKMVNQVLCGVHIAAAAEALSLAESLGIDAGLAWDTVRRGAAASFMLDDRGRRMVEGTQGEVRSAVSIFVKDLRLVLDNARTGGLPTPLVAAAEQLFSIAAAQGLAGRDDSELIEVFRGWLR